MVNLDNERPPYRQVMTTEQAMDELKDSLHLKGNDEWDELLMQYIKDNYEKKERQLLVKRRVVKDEGLVVTSTLITLPFFYFLT